MISQQDNRRSRPTATARRVIAHQRNEYGVLVGQASNLWIEAATSYDVTKAKMIRAADALTAQGARPEVLTVSLTRDDGRLAYISYRPLEDEYRVSVDGRPVFWQAGSAPGCTDEVALADSII